MGQTANAATGSGMRTRQFALHHASRPLNLLKLIPGALERSGVDVDGRQVRVRMSPLGEAIIPRDSIVRVWRTRAGEQGVTFRLRLPVGVHTNFRGVWWMTNSSHNLVTIDIDPPAIGHMWGVPVRLKRVVVSLEDPDGFIAEVLG